MRFLKSFNPAGKTKLLELTYMVTIALLLSTVVFATVFITHHFLLIKKYVIQEDAVEAVLISILLLIAYLLSNFYKKELKKYLQQTRKLSRDNSNLLNKLIDAFKYIGGVNVQIQEIRSIFCGLRRYPATENEFRKDVALFARKVLGIVNADWVVIRIIGQTNLRTIKEHFEPRRNANFIIKGISNRALVANQAIDGYSIVASRHDNSKFTVACIFPKKSLDEEEKILVEAITYQIEMLYLIFVSRQPHEIYPNHKPITGNSKEVDNVKRKASL
jgi:hypothetical protein